jgi:uroporphyrinogen decarboxylase
MNSKELVDCLIRKKSVDRMGYADKIWVEAHQGWQDKGYLSRTDSAGQKSKVSFEEFFGAELREIWNINCLPFLDDNVVIEETDEWQITRNGAGAKFKNWKHKSGTPEHMDFDMASFDIWKNKYKPQLTFYNKQRCNYKGTEELLTQCKNDNLFSVYGNLGIWELLRSSLGDVCMFESLLDDPDWIHDFNSTYTDFFITHMTEIFKVNGQPDGFWVYDDLAYNKGLFCSPTLLQELFYPYYRKLTDFLHGLDIPVIMHSCGNVEVALPFIIECGFDALNPMEVKAGCDVVRFAQNYGDKLAFLGGFDVRILENGDRWEIKKEVLRITKAMRETKASYMFGTDHSVTPNVNFEDYLYAVECFNENSHY